MKKRTFAMMTASVLLTALCTAGSIPSGAEEMLVLTRDTDGTVTIRVEEQMPAAPETPEWAYAWYSNNDVVRAVREGEYGRALYHSAYPDLRVYVVTDSEGLSAEYTPRDGIYPYHIYPTGIEDIDKNIDWEKFAPPYTTQLNGVEVFPGDDDFPENGEELMKSHGDGARLYYIEWNELSLTQTVEYALCVSDPHVLDVYDSVKYADTAAIWDGQFILHTPILEEWIDPDTKEFVDGFTEKDVLIYYFGEELPERLAQLTREEYPAWLASYSAWRDTVDYNSLTEQERAASLEAAGIMNDWEITKKATDLANEFKTAYQARGFAETAGIQLVDLRFSVRPEVDTTQVFHVEDIWESYGDYNDDTAVDAADAAEILSLAAQNGAEGSGHPGANYYYQTGDFNLDGYVNALDAADLLLYLADQGAGSGQSVKEYVTSLQPSVS